MTDKAKAESILPGGITDEDRPSVDDQKRMLEAKITELKHQGFSLELQANSIAAQTPGVSEKTVKDQQVKALRNQSENAYASARRLKAQLGELVAANPPTES